MFEIGSVTKVFTSLLLSDMVQRGEVTLTDPVVKFLPAGAKVPERGGRQITVRDLATHTSGLPRMPSNFAPKEASNPYADYGKPTLRSRSHRPRPSLNAAALLVTHASGA